MPNASGSTEDLAIAYVAMGMFLSTLIHFSAAQYMLKPKEQQEELELVRHDVAKHASQRNSAGYCEVSSSEPHVGPVVLVLGRGADADAAAKSAALHQASSDSTLHSDSEARTNSKAGDGDRQTREIECVIKASAHSAVPLEDSAHLHGGASNLLASNVSASDGAPATLDQDPEEKNLSRPDRYPLLRGNFSSSSCEYQRVDAGWGHQSGAAQMAGSRHAASSSDPDWTLPPGHAPSWRRRAAAAWVAAKPVLREFGSPPIVACFLALIVGTIPQVKAVLFLRGGALNVVGDVIRMFGECAIPCMIMVLGATLANGPGEGKLPMRVILGVTLGRLVILPMFGTVVVLGSYWTGLFKPPDPVFVLVMLVQQTAPTAISISTMASMFGNGEQEISSLLFYQYMSCILTIPWCLCLYLYLMQTYLSL